MTAIALTPLEIATGLVFGRGQSRVELPHRPSVDPIKALEDAIAPALERPPCLVSFSGGRDSSAVLAVATRLARREGLPLPIPVTNRFPSAPETDESEWQERVVDHVKSDDWIRLSFTSELEAVGPAAARVLRRHGLLWPFNAYFHDPLLERAAEGSLLTGIGGDELLGGSHWVRPASVLRGRVRPEPRDLLRAGVALSPAFVRRLVLTRRAPEGFSWLRPQAAREFQRAWAAQTSTEPMRWAPRWRWWRELRLVEVGFDGLRRLADDHGAQIYHPLADAAFARAAGQLASRAGVHTREPLTLELFGDVLPTEVCRRRSKARFDAAFWGSESRRFVGEWRGGGVDSDVIDEAALGEEWNKLVPDAHTFLLLQSLWLRGTQSALTPAA